VLWQHLLCSCVLLLLLRCCVPLMCRRHKGQVVHLAAAALTACGGALVLLLLLHCCHRCDQAPVHVQPVMLELPAAELVLAGAVLHALPSLVLQLRRLLLCGCCCLPVV
jgi:hypothetical protein